MMKKYRKTYHYKIKISFEGIGNEPFESNENFCRAFLNLIVKALKSPSVAIEEEYIKEWEAPGIIDFDLLSLHITKMSRDKKIVLMIDEVDKTSNNKVFLNFVAMLRDKYLSR